MEGNKEPKNSEMSMETPEDNSMELSEEAKEAQEQMQKNQNQTPHLGRGPGGGPGGPKMKEKPHHMRKTLFRLISYIGRSKYILIMLLLVMTGVTMLDLLGPTLQGRAIDTITMTEGKLSVDLDAMVYILLVMAVIFIAASILTYLQGLLSAKLSQDTVYMMRNDLFHSISYLPISYTDSHRHGDIMSRMTNDVENVSNAISQSIASLISSIITFVGAVYFMVRCNIIVTIVAFITVPLTILLSTKLSKFMRKYFLRQQVLLGKLNSEVEEMVTGYKTVVAYGREGDAVEKFSDVSENLRSTSIKSRVWGSIMGPCMNLLGNMQYVLVAGLGTFFVIRGAMSVGNIQEMLQYSKKFSRPINEIANQYSTILTALAGAERIFEIMDAEPEVNWGTTPMPKDSVKGEIDFQNMDFGYVPEHMVLKHLNLKVSAGKKVAIVGATGSGKTTIVNLLTRFYELNGGRILVDGVDITEIPKKDLRDSIAIVLQDTVLFADTIKNNICYGNEDADMDAVKRAAHMAKADIFIERLPEGYDTMLTEGGSNLSQGQRQLLAIARAIIAEPRILILDEATSSVDTHTEMDIQQAMVALMKNRTSLIIAHRLSTIRDSDVIVVLAGGEIVESGSHETLLAQKGEYYKLYQNQFAGKAI